MSEIDQIRQLPFWQSAISIAPLDGGITNHNFIVTTDHSEISSGDETQSNGQEKSRFVVRLGDDIPEHQIIRFNEVAASKAAHAAGLSPAIRYHENGVLVMDYIESNALSVEQVQKQAMLERIVPLIKKCHKDVPLHLRGASIVFWVFHVLRDYAWTLKQGRSSHIDKIPTLLSAAERLELASGPYDIVFGHNDLLAANFLDDGEKLWLIDWEYGGFNTPLFDLGGLASNNELSETQERWILTSYFEKDVSDELWYRYQAMKTASLLRETMWSMVSEIHSTLNFDYGAYTKSNLAHFEASFTEFKKL